MIGKIEALTERRQSTLLFWYPASFLPWKYNKPRALKQRLRALQIAGLMYARHAVVTLIVKFLFNQVGF